MAVKIKIQNTDKPKEPENPKIKLEARKTLDGKIMILDHHFIDIILDTNKKQITVFPKTVMTDEVYGYQDQYLNYLVKEGVVEPETIKGGNVFGSLEAFYPDSVDKNIDPSQVVLLTTKNFLDEQKPYIDAVDFIEDNIEDHYVEPEQEDTTPLGRVPQSSKKGSITPYRIRKYLSGYGYY